MSKTLVAYFSASGTTRSAAGMIASKIGADLFEIAPEVPYSLGDLDWRDSKSRSTVEMKDEKSRPSFIKEESLVDDYETVFIGFPNWWGVEPRIIDTFLEAYDFSGKTVIPFFTSGGSGKGKIRERIEKEAKGARVMDAERIRLSDDITRWLKSLGF